MPTLTACTIAGNSATNGGGVSCSQSSPRLTDCSITGNSVSGNCRGHCDPSGGGLFVTENSSPILSGCTITENSAESNGGGVFFCDGSATLTLARPVGRSAYALARLTGCLTIALVTGAVLLSATALLLHARAGMPLGPAAWGLVVCAVGALGVGAFAMAASLFLPQIATTLLVLVAVGWIALVNLLAQFGAELQGVHAAIDRFGPPLGSALMVVLAPWIQSVSVTGEPVALVLRLAVWAGAGLALLVLTFRRSEFGR